MTSAQKAAYHQALTNAVLTHGAYVTDEDDVYAIQTALAGGEFGTWGVYGDVLHKQSCPASAPAGSVPVEVTLGLYESDEPTATCVTCDYAAMTQLTVLSGVSCACGLYRDALLVDQRSLVEVIDSVLSAS